LYIELGSKDQRCICVFAAGGQPASIRPELHESTHLWLHVGQVPHEFASRLPILLLLLLLTMMATTMMITVTMVTIAFA